MNILRLRRVEIADFRRSEATNYVAFALAHPTITRGFRPDDVVGFVSESLRQIVFVYGFTDLADGRYRVLPSIRLRLEEGEWTGELLTETMQKMGITMRGLDTAAFIIAQHRAAREERKNAERRDKLREREREARRLSRYQAPAAAVG